MTGTAVVQVTGGRKYRFHLTRTWDPDPQRLLFVMLNPSRADADADDHTVHRCTGLAARRGYGGIEVVNLFGLVSPVPRDLLDAPDDDPVGIPNASALRTAFEAHSMAVAAWGAPPAPKALTRLVSGRVSVVWRLALDKGCRWVSFGVTAGGHPRHPSRLPTRALLEPWRPPDE